MKNFLLVNGPLFLAAALIFFRCRSVRIPRSAEILADLFQVLMPKEKNGEYFHTPRCRKNRTSKPEHLSNP